MLGGVCVRTVVAIVACIDGGGGIIGHVNFGGALAFDCDGYSGLEQNPPSFWACGEFSCIGRLCDFNLALDDFGGDGAWGVVADSAAICWSLVGTLGG